MPGRMNKRSLSELDITDDERLLEIAVALEKAQEEWSEKLAEYPQRLSKIKKAWYDEYQTESRKTHRRMYKILEDAEKSGLLNEELKDFLGRMHAQVERHVDAMHGTVEQHNGLGKVARSTRVFRSVYTKKTVG